MSFDFETASLLTRQILGVGILLQSMEVFITRRIYPSGGALELQTFKSASDVGIIAILRMMIASWLMLPHAGACETVTLVAVATLACSSVYLTIRTRGPMCGGSDSMYFQVQLGLLAISLGFVNPLLPKLGLGWIVAQNVLSYFLAGVAKIRNARWRNGDAMKSLFASRGAYVLFEPVRAFAGSRATCVLLSWSVVLFELLFPLVLVLPMEGKLALLSFGIIFHVINAVVLGLNRFIWAWAATYPAVLYFGVTI